MQQGRGSELREGGNGQRKVESAQHEGVRRQEEGTRGLLLARLRARGLGSARHGDSRGAPPVFVQHLFWLSMVRVLAWCNKARPYASFVLLCLAVCFAQAPALAAPKFED